MSSACLPGKKKQKEKEKYERETFNRYLEPRETPQRPKSNQYTGNVTQRETGVCRKWCLIQLHIATILMNN